jgi:hypothetical protein
MHPIQIIQTFSRSERTLPVKAIRWCRANWAAVAPKLLAVLERHTHKWNRTHGDASALFFILHLFAERRETPAFDQLCQLALDPEALRRILGQGVTETLGGMFIGTYGGDPTPLKAVIEAPDADDMVRTQALEALGFLTAAGRFPRQDMEAYLRELHDRMLPRDDEACVWYGWVLVAALLRLDTLEPLVDDLFARDVVPPDIIGGAAEYRELRDEALADPDPLAGFARESVKPIVDIVALLSKWAAFKGGGEDDEPLVIETLDQAVAAFASAENELPVGAMLWCRNNWDAAGADLIRIVERFADTTDRAEGSASAALFILHLAAEQRDTRALAPLCRLARDYDALESVIGDDGVTESLPSILIGVFDGDPAPLRAIVEAPDIDEYVRGGALEAIGFLAAAGRLPLAETKGYLLGLCDTLQPQAPSFLWFEWSATSLRLRIDGAMDQIERLHTRAFIDPTIWPMSEFHEMRDEALAAPDMATSFERDRLRQIDDAIDELSRWVSFRGDEITDHDDDDDEPTDEDLARWARKPEPPAVNPFKDVGRNDPCPCGSGKKFKKCCLGVVPGAS